MFVLFPRKLKYSSRIVAAFCKPRVGIRQIGIKHVGPTLTDQSLASVPHLFPSFVFLTCSHPIIYCNYDILIYVL